MIRLLVVGRVRVHAQALATALSERSEFQVVGTATTGPELVEQLQATRPDVVLLDAAMVEARTAATDVRRLAKDVKVIAITIAETEQEIMELAEAGVAGYVLPDGSLEDLVVAVESAARGELRVSPRVAYRLIRRLGSLVQTLDHEEHGPLTELTTREREILQFIDRNTSNKEIARQLGIRVGTVKNHVHNILEKLHVHRRINAAEWFRKAGFHLRLEA